MNTTNKNTSSTDSEVLTHKQGSKTTKDSKRKNSSTHIIGDRLKRLRKENGLSQTEFAVAFSNFIGKESVYRRTTISGWENENPAPSRKILQKLADFYNVPFNVLSLDDRASVINVSESKKLKTDDLWQVDNEPVWCVFTQAESGLSVYGKWGIVDASSGEIIFSKRHSVSFTNINFEMYRRPLPFSFPPDAMGRVLTKKEVCLRNQIWIEPIGGDYQTRQLLKSWGSYNKQQDSVICDNGMIYPLRLYAKTFLAYSDPCEYKTHQIK